MNTLSIDLETFSSVDIKKSGLYKYVQSADFEILLFAYGIDDEPVQIIDLAQGETIPKEITDALFNRNVVKKAYNAPFEWYCLCKHFNVKYPFGYLAQWQCTMHHALYCGYPVGLGAVANAMGFPEDKKKMTAGKALIKKFCVPCNPSKANGYRTRNLPHHEPEQWDLFKEYCKQDVVVEREINGKLSAYPVPFTENYLWQIDQYINCCGVKVDTDLIEGAIELHEQITAELTAEAIQLTGLDNPNSPTQLKAWLEEKLNRKIEGLDKETVKGLIDELTKMNDPDTPNYTVRNTVRAISNRPQDTQQIIDILKIRQELGKTSIKKYHAMDEAVCSDNRVRGLLQFYGANRTGRWAGRLVQVQNLPRNYLSTLDIARKFVKEKNIEAIKLLYGNVPDTISQLIRTAFIPADGCEFHIADFSAIEARVIAWLADEQWRLDVFKTHGKIYEASASAMFGVPLEHIVKDRPEYALRQKGKVAELALGYQGGANALVTMGALNMGLAEEELPDIVRRWRQANKRIVDFWYTVENAAIECVEYGVVTSLQKGITFGRDEHNMIITLPSGRQLFYVNPTTTPNQWGKSQVRFYGVNQDTKKWGLIPTYGGKLVENIVQAVARDCLAESIIHLYEAGYTTVMHIHDECVLEVPMNDKEKSLEQAIQIMCKPIKWAEGLPLNADGFSGIYYKKE